MSSRRALAILIGIILIFSGIVYFFGIPGIFEVRKTPDNIWGVILLVGGGIITFFAALNEATEFIQKLFSRKRKDLLRHEKPYDINGRSNLQNRLNVIANVREAWIKGVLENNLQDAVRLELDLQETPEILMRPNVRLRYQTKNERAISPGFSIYQIFQESSQNLLILGAPGSGKTFTMLELARDLLNEAEGNEHTPVPVVLNLSSWARERPSLEDWIADEIWLQYQLAKNVTYVWLKHDQLCLLLDGLDEVAQEQRVACVEAINSFKLEHTNPMVVCSRTENYTNLAARLNLSRAIEIQPLTETQVEKYLSERELQLQEVRTALNYDPDLRALAKTPLFLNVITMSYRGMRAEELSKLENKEDHRHHLFNTYISRMLRRRPLLKNNPYGSRQALSWLIYLARQLIQQAQTTFFIERLQISWLPPTDQRTYRFILALAIGSVFGSAIGAVFWMVWGWIIALIVALVIGWLTGRRFWRHDRPILPVDRLRLRRPNWIILRSGLKYGLSPGLASGLFIGILALVLGLLDHGLDAGLAFGWAFGSLFGLATWLVVGMLFILEGALIPLESQHRALPNQGIKRSLHNMAFYILAFGLVSGLASGFVFYLVGRMSDVIIVPLPFVLDFGLVCGLAGGIVGGLVTAAGQAVTRHYILRVVLRLNGSLPMKLIPFLDGTTERLMLRRVGGGYIFIHRSLMEHFASLSEEDLDALVAQIEGWQFRNY